MFSGGLLGNIGMPQQYQSFNPGNSPSANMFDMYMQHAMRQYGGPGGFFGFMPRQMTQTQAPAPQQPAYNPGASPTGNPDHWNPVGGGN